MTLVSNLVLAAESRMANRAGKTRAHQVKRVEPESVEAAQSVVQKPGAIVPEVARESPSKPDVIPVEKVRPLELNRVRG
jgi:hypothetical protein